MLRLILIGLLSLALVACGEQEKPRCMDCGEIPSTPYAAAQNEVGTLVLTTPVPTATPEQAPAIVEMVEERVEGFELNLVWIPLIILVILSPWWGGWLAAVVGMTGETAISHSHADEHVYYEHTQTRGLGGLLEGGVLVSKDPNGSKKDFNTAFKRWRNLIALVLIVLTVGGIASWLLF